MRASRVFAWAAFVCVVALGACAPMSIGPPVVTDVPRQVEERSNATGTTDDAVTQEGSRLTVRVTELCDVQRVTRVERTTVREHQNDTDLETIEAASAPLSAHLAKFPEESHAEEVRTALRPSEVLQARLKEAKEQREARVGVRSWADAGAEGTGVPSTGQFVPYEGNGRGPTLCARWHVAALERPGHMLASWQHRGRKPPGRRKPPLVRRALVGLGTSFVGGVAIAVGAEGANTREVAADERNEIAVEREHGRLSCGIDT